MLNIILNIYLIILFIIGRKNKEGSTISKGRPHKQSNSLIFFLETGSIILLNAAK